MIDDARRYYHTLRNLKPWQVAGRLIAPIRRRATVRRLPPVPAQLHVQGQLQTLPPAHDPWNERDALLGGQFTFLRDPAELGWPPDWSGDDMPLLWRFNLHYFHLLHLLEPQEQVDLCRSWIDANPEGTTPAWHPYPTSLRVVNWCKAAWQHKAMRAEDVLASVYRQTAFLARNLETYVYGNHLLENARALVVAGAFFGRQGEGPQWLERGLALYRQETREQILRDGGHYERSPMYHALMLEGYLDVLNVLPGDHEARGWISRTAERMADVLAAFIHPDGRLALLNDSTFEIALRPDVLADYLQRLTGYVPDEQRQLPDTGYFVHRAPGLYLIIDGGAVAPEHLMAHAHADVFSYELSLGGLRMIVDSGVYEYPPGAMRQYVRSTAAHNTVSIDGTDQVECWGSFRVARRAAPSDVVFFREEQGCRFRGRFDGYAKWLGDGIVHTRTVTLDEEARTIEVRDDLEGRGDHVVESRIHLHPEVEVRGADNVVEVARDDVSFELHVEGSWRIESGWYCPRFGQRVSNDVLVIGERTTLPVRYAYRLHY